MEFREGVSRSSLTCCCAHVLCEMFLAVVCASCFEEGFRLCFLFFFSPFAHKLNASWVPETGNKGITMARQGPPAFSLAESWFNFTHFNTDCDMLKCPSGLGQLILSANHDWISDDFMLFSKIWKVQQKQLECGIMQEHCLFIYLCVLQLNMLLF